MSLSHPSARQTNSRLHTQKKESNWWDDLPAVLHCPTCGKKTMRRVSSPCQLLDGTLIPELERFQCSACKANFFDDAAMHTIDKFRKSISHKPSQLRRRARVEKAEVV
jgi:hypothetical protein